MLRNPISIACSALLSALSPEPFSIIESCRSIEWRLADQSGERIEIEFSLPNERCRQHAAELAAGAPSAKIDLGRSILASLSADLRGDRFRLEALVILE